MPFNVECPGCHAVIEVRDQDRGKRGRCPACGTVVDIPDPPPGPPATSPAPIGAARADAGIPPAAPAEPPVRVALVDVDVPFRSVLILVAKVYGAMFVVGIPIGIAYLMLFGR